MKNIRKLHKRTLVFTAVAVMLAITGLGVRSAHADTDHHHDFTPVWQEVARTITLNPNNPAPEDVVTQLVSLQVAYKDFNGTPHEGIIEVNRALENDTIAFFKYAYYLNFPINEVGVSSDPRFHWDDNKLMAANITSGFNYRTIAGTNRPSKHGLGRAFDVNPRQNPYVTLDEQGNPVVAPKGASWLAGTPGTLHRDHPLIQLMQSRGWTWGGTWTLQDTDGAVIDYQHLQKSASAPASTSQTQVITDKE
jgi:hypothetical protein